jgi:uncharacterized membrane protein
MQHRGRSQLPAALPNLSMSIALLLHLLSVVIWVGGMFFALAALRPAAIETLEPPLRLPLFAVALGHFFVWVTVAIVVILASGVYLIIGLGGLRTAGAYVHAMMTLGIVMMLIFVHVRVVSYRRLRAAIERKAWADAGAALGSIRRFVTINLVLGLATMAVAVLGRGL